MRWSESRHRHRLAKREQADDMRAHLLLEEEEGGGKGPDPLTIV